MKMEIHSSDVANQVLETCESTNDLARALGERGYPQGTWVSSRIQTRGRGRLGRSWQSMPGNLFLSMLARIPDTSSWSWVPLTAAVSAVEAALEQGFRRDLRIKWPNDLLIDGSKAGGILCEGVSGPGGPFIVIGLGINCAQAPEGLDQPTAFLGVEDLGSFRIQVVDALIRRLRELGESGPGAIRKAYETHAWLAPGTRIQWSDRSGSVVGLGPHGELQVREEPGGLLRSLFAEDVKIRT